MQLVCDKLFQHTLVRERDIDREKHPDAEDRTPDVSDAPCVQVPHAKGEAAEGSGECDESGGEDKVVDLCCNT